MTDPRSADSSADFRADFRALFRDLRIDDQREYYERTRAEYRRAHRQAIVVRNVALGLGAVCGAVAGFDVGSGVRAWLGVASAVLAGLAAAVTGFEALIGFARLEKLYGDAARNLELATADWDGLDPAADPSAGMDRVEEILGIENGHWGQLVVEAAPAAEEP